MLTSMNRETFGRMDDESLIWACIEPTIRQIRGKNHSVKFEAYEGLTEGQRALLMFQIMYGHSKSGVTEFYAIVPHLPSGNGIWVELKKSMRYFGDLSMLQLLSELEGDYGPRSSVDKNNALFFEALPAAIRKIAAYIRDNPSEFISFEER